MLRAYIRRVLELPPHVALERAARLAGRTVAQRLGRGRDLLVSTHPATGPSRLAWRIALAARDVPPSLASVLPALVGRTIEHRFDLLGSGWVQLRHGLTAAGLGGHRYPAGSPAAADPEGNWLADHVSPANLPESQRLWRLIEGPYQPIDWQIDFKSGYRWDGRRHFRDLSFGAVAGADVKVPWELSRLQHLPQLAIAHLLAHAGHDGFEAPDVYAREVRNQIVDFLAANPPRFGVNWLCPMDVGIRAANMLLAVDLLRAGGARIPAAFEGAVAKAASAHARHILANLEWSASPRSNHYLADIAGVMFCAVYLPADAETDAWLDFAAQQFSVEIPAQFLADGGNFEGSTNYHRLSAELALFSVAAVMGVAAERAGAFAAARRHRLRVRPPLGEGTAPGGEDSAGAAIPVSAQAIARLHKAVACVAGWSKPDGRPPQIGDTDSGRLFKLHPAVAEVAGAPSEDLLDHRALLSAGAALFDRAPTEWGAGARCFDGIVIAALADGRTLACPTQPADGPPADPGALTALAAQIRALPAAARRETAFDLPGLKPASLARHCYPDFGLIVLRNDETFLSLRCVSAYDRSHTLGHYHDDNLALELQHRGRELVTDPGSYLYTPLPAIRERYRSASAHAAPRCADRSAAKPVSAFAMRFDAQARCVHAGRDGIGAMLEGDGWKAFRAVLIESGRVLLLDGCMPGALAPLAPPLPVARGYGKL